MSDPKAMADRMLNQRTEATIIGNIRIDVLCPCGKLVDIHAGTRMVMGRCPGCDRRFVGSLCVYVVSLDELLPKETI